MTVASPTLHHYVPRFMLRRFGVGKKDHVWVYDKKADKTFQASTGRVAVERGMYDFEFEGQEMTLETSLANLEKKVATLIKRIIETRDLRLLSVDDRETLAAFLSVQMIRTNAAREQFRDIGEQMARWLRESAEPDSEELAATEHFIGEFKTENIERLHMARMIYNAPKDFSQALLEKVWTLAETPRRHPFLIGDNPFAMINNIDYGPRGNVGIAVRGIEIYIPLTPELQLCLYCPTLIDELQEQVMAEERLLQQGSTRPRNFRAAQLLQCIEAGKPFLLLEENVEHCNSLQILHAERFVISCIPNFDMAKEMIASDPAVRHGRRSQIGT